MKRMMLFLIGVMGLPFFVLVVAFFFVTSPLLILSNQFDYPDPTFIYPETDYDITIDPELLNQEYVWPLAVPATITSGFENRINPVTGKAEKHLGIDISNGKGGVPVFAMADGVVIRVGAVSGFGQAIFIDHGNGLFTRYGHLQWNAMQVREGEKVKKGQYIGQIGYGLVGTSTGPHVQFEVIINGKAEGGRMISGTWVDPLLFVSPSDKRSD